MERPREVQPAGIGDEEAGADAVVCVQTNMSDYELAWRFAGAAILEFIEVVGFELHSLAPLPDPSSAGAGVMIGVTGPTDLNQMVDVATAAFSDNDGFIVDWWVRGASKESASLS